MTVVVYTKSNCPACVQTKRLLTAEKIEFEEMDAVEHIEYLSGLGARGAPVIVDGDKVIHGFIPDQLRSLNN